MRLGPFILSRQQQILEFVRSGRATPFAEGAFVGLHGNGNRDVQVGYKVIFVPFGNGRPSGPPTDFVTGFQANGKTMGRPVGVTLDPKGALIRRRRPVQCCLARHIGAVRDSRVTSA